MIDIKIEKGVKIPESKGGYGTHKQRWMQMKVGDSFLLPDMNYVQAARQAFSHLKKRNPKFKNWAIISRKVEGGFRFWRTK